MAELRGRDSPEKWGIQVKSPVKYHVFSRAFHPLAIYNMLHGRRVYFSSQQLITDL
jgi:hypothetical protein